ncbi:hypothetical protein NA57DRAFT_73390 [Rhizodiscina lignyota]|uniref:Uncharacterized protein n=1 Tax=Rhizodiscina lignyota TaxID=1504668 RepID=A0A9P4M8R2_9PEZI|nr:hypothetical protein NA57DRAFT_73390 [Rhizodiscina lignyota]
MKNILFTLPLLAAVLAAPAPELATERPERCGPTSNCEAVVEDGSIVYRFKLGMEPGSEDYKSRFSGLSKRDSTTTDVILGKTQIDYGCDASIRKTLNGAIEKLCTESGCDGGSDYSRDVDWTDGGGAPVPTGIKVTVEGAWHAKNSKEAYNDAVMATVNPKSAVPEERRWRQNGFQGDVVGICKMSKFPNYIHISRFNGNNMQDEIIINVELEKNEDLCLATSVLGAVAGAVNGVAGGFFGVASAVCGSG